MNVPKRGRPATLTAEGRKAQLRGAQADHRVRLSESGRTRLETVVRQDTKDWLMSFKAEHNLDNLGAALDAIKDMMVK